MCLMCLMNPVSYAKEKKTLQFKVSFLEQKIEAAKSQYMAEQNQHVAPLTPPDDVLQPGDRPSSSKGQGQSMAPSLGTLGTGKRRLLPTSQAPTKGSKRGKDCHGFRSSDNAPEAASSSTSTPPWRQAQTEANHLGKVLFV